MHLSGAVYAETFLKDAVEDHLCLDPIKHTLVRNIGLTRSLPPQPVCAEGMLSAATALRDQTLYDAMVNSFSMRSFVPTPGISGHDQFFATFPRFGALDPAHTAEWLDEVATRAAAQNEQYLEVMLTPAFSKTAALGYSLGWPVPPVLTTDADTSLAAPPLGASPAELATLREKLLAGGLRDEAAAETASRSPQPSVSAGSSSTAPNPPPPSPAQSKSASSTRSSAPFPRSRSSPRLSSPLKSPPPSRTSSASTSFSLRTPTWPCPSTTARCSCWTTSTPSTPRSTSPCTPVSSPAASSPPPGLRFHIREAVELGHAERIGHGVDVMNETDPQQLLHELAARHISIEINLTSNDVILGVSTNRHSLPAYRAAGVPVAFATDDEGVSRIDLTHEYTRAALDFNLTYADLKRSARTSLEHAFLPGPSLWLVPDDFTRPNPACASTPLGSATPAPACAAFLKSSPHATQQWELEHRYHLFESTLP